MESEFLNFQFNSVKASLKFESIQTLNSERSPCSLILGKKIRNAKAGLMEKEERSKYYINGSDFKINLFSSWRFLPKNTLANYEM